VTNYVLRRILGLVPLLLGISVISFAMMYIAPGGPTSVFLSSSHPMSPVEIANIRHNLGLDKPWFVQYFFWLSNMLHGNFGFSFTDGRPVLTKILEKAPVTALLIGISFLVTILIAIPVAVYSAVHKNSTFDYIATAIAFIGYGTPTFWLGIELIQLFSVKWHLLPDAGLTQIDATGFDLGDRVRHLILPVATLTFVSLAGWIRYQRSSMLEVLGEDFIRTAAAKGLSRNVVIFKHAFRNALLPLITLLGLYLPALLTGAYFVETIFTIPGLGYLGLNAIFERDYPTVMGTTVISAVLVVIGNLLADIGYAAADPRIRYD
jgi:peptide/nickel transport system permease protein